MLDKDRSSLHINHTFCISNTQPVKVRYSTTLLEISHMTEQHKGDTHRRTHTYTFQQDRTLYKQYRHMCNVTNTKLTIQA